MAGHLSASRLTRLARLQRERRDEVVADWEQAVRAQGPLEGKGMDRPSLIDFIPEMLERMADAVEAAATGRPRPTPEPEARRHALERLEHGYDLDEVHREYALLRKAVVERCVREAPEIGPGELEVVQEVIDEAMASTTSSFVRAREQTLQAFDGISAAALANPQVDALLQRLLEVIQGAIPISDSVAILLLDGDRLYVRAALGLEEEQRRGFSLGVGEGFAGKVAADRKPLLLREASTDPLVRSEVIRARGIRALYGVPLEHGGRLLGVAHLGSRTASEFSEEDLLLFRAMTERAASAIAHAEYVTREQVGHAVSRVLAASSSLEEAIPKLLAEIGETCGWRVGSAWLLDRSAQVLRPHSSWCADPARASTVEAMSGQVELRPGEGLPGRALQAGKTIWESDVALAPDFPRKAVALREGLHSAVVFPLRSGERVLGVLEFFSDRLRSPAEALVRMTTLLADPLGDFMRRLEAQERLRLALEAAEMGTWDEDPATGRVHWDARSRALFGLPPDAEVTRDIFLSRLHPEDRERVQAQVQGALDPAGSGEHDIEYRTVHLPDVGERWLRATGRAYFEGGRAVRFVGTVRDITALKAAQETLQRSERELRLLTEAMPQLVWTARADGQLDYVNPRLAQYLGARAAAFLASAREEAIHPEDLPNFVQVWERAVATGEPFQVEARVRRNDGVYRWHLSRAGALLDEQGRVRKWVGTSTDIDDLKRAEAELRRRADFEQQLIGIVSHDLRNPLNAILLSARALLRSGGFTVAQASALARLSSAAERATRLTRDLLDFTRVRLGGGIPIERTPLDLHELVRRVLDEVRLAHPERTIELTARGDGQGVLDGDRLAQVVTNLVNNAIVYSSAGTPIRVETRSEEGALVLSVQNQGAPIPPDLLPRLFEPMRRGTEKEAAAGSVGLGLFIVDSLVKAHSGRIEVRSTAEEGTTFRVVLPRVPPESPAPPSNLPR